MSHREPSSTASRLHGQDSSQAERIVGHSEMARCVREFDWASTPMGPIASWSETLLSHVNLLLCSPMPASLYWGPELTFLYNDAALPTIGERHPRALGRSYRENFSDAWDRVGADMEDCLLRGMSTVRENVPVPMVRNGVVEEGYYTYSMIPVYEGGKIVGIYDPYQNTTQAVLAERERAKQEERLELALSAANGVGIWDWDIPADAVFTDANFAKLYGVDPTDGERGIPLAAFTANIHKDDMERVGREIAAAIKAGSDFASEYRLVQADGSVRWVFARGRCYLDHNGVPLRFPGVTIDITRRVEMEDALRHGAAELRRNEEALLSHEEALRSNQEALRQNEEKFRTFVEAVSDVVYRVSADWGEALQVEGRGFLPDTHAPDRDWFQRNVHPDDQARVWAAIQKAIREGSVFALEHKVQRLDGTTGWTYSRAIPVRDQDGRVVEWFGAASDITTRKQAELALLSAEKLAVVGRLASSIAHEINNPLEAMTNLLYLAEKTADADTRTYLIAAEAELRRVSHIATNTLQFNRQKLTPEPFDVIATMQAVLDLYQGRCRQAAISVEFEREDCPTFHGLGGEIRQVFANLVGNAIDAMGKGGRLKVRVRPVTNWKTGQPSVRVTLADNGCGMSEKTLASLFKPFFTTKQATGTGLGLWISAEIVHRHKGTIRVRSSEAEGASGTTFSLLFPCDGAAGG